MEAISTQRRPRVNAQERAQWISRYRSSHLPAPQFAQQHGLQVGTVQRWIQQECQRKSLPHPPQVHRLLQIAHGDTGGSRRVASVRLSLWNGDQFQCDLQALLYVGGDLLEELLALIAYLHQHSLQLDDLVSQSAMDPVLAMWGPTIQG